MIIKYTTDPINAQETIHLTLVFEIGVCLCVCACEKEIENIKETEHSHPQKKYTKER